MNKHWRDFYNKNAIQFRGDLKKQVSKTILGEAVNDDQIGFILQAIDSVLKLSKKDHVVDLCCGNGMLTAYFANKCRFICGVDFSDGLIEIARQIYAGSNIEFNVSDVANLGSGFFKEYNRIYMYEGIQYLALDTFEELLKKISTESQAFTFFIGGVPDIDRLQSFYDTEQRYLFYLESVANNKPHVGRWWSKKEIADLCKNSNLNVRFLDQNEKLYTSSYRFDCVISNGELGCL